MGQEQALWEPSKEQIDGTNLARFIKFVRGEWGVEHVVDYADLYQWSILEPERFWLSVWDFCGIRAQGEREPVLVDKDRMPGARWFPNVRLNFAQNLLRHRDERAAIVFRDEVGNARSLSYIDLHDAVSRWQQALRASGVVAGDRVAGLMPNIPETVIAMLATTSLGAVWSSCSPDFGVDGVIDRFGQIEPKILVTVASYAYGGKLFELGPKIASIAKAIKSIERVVVVPYLNPSGSLKTIRAAVNADDFIAEYPAAAVEFVATAFDDPLYIMYSSGTTGVPKCIVHGAGGTLIQHLKEHVLHGDLKREDKIFYYSTCGWMMWNWLVSALAVGATVVLYDGSPSHPDGNALWDLADELGIGIFGTSAKWLAATEKAGIAPRCTHKLGALKTILSTGSPLAPEGFDYVYREVKERVLLASISGGTDIISCFALGNPLLPVWRGELQSRGLGMKVEVIDEHGAPVRETPGELACLAPFPSMPIGFWNDPDGAKYRAAYFETQPGIWCHGDFATLTRHDGVIIHGRSDATLNPGGVRIGTAEIYRQVEGIPEVLESLAIGQDFDGDVRVVLFVRLRDGLNLDQALSERIRRVVRDGTTPRHVPAKIIQVPDLPRTLSGKLTELAVRNVVHGRAVKNTHALANPQALDYFRDLGELRN